MRKAKELQQEYEGLVASLIDAKAYEVVNQWLVALMPEERNLFCEMSAKRQIKEATALLALIRENKRLRRAIARQKNADAPA